MTDIKRILYGKYDKERIVSCEVTDTTVELFVQELDGTIKTEVKPFKPWILGPKKYDSSWKELDGDLYYKYIRKFNSIEEYKEAAKLKYKFNLNTVHNMKEQAMIYYGFTYFKGMTPKDVGVLSFDIETTSILHNDSSKVLLISNTFRQGDKIIKKLFSYENYSCCGEMINDWCQWVKEVNPTIIIGHNIFLFDFPYIIYCANRDGYNLNLGRDNSDLVVDNYLSKFRKDQTQFYEYRNLHIYGREIIDTFFLSIKFDVAAKKYENYKLKNIIKQEGLEKQGRSFYDADKIRFNYKDPIEWEKIKDYCIDDSDDALALFDLMIPATFYSNQMIPKPTQIMVNSATGAQLNTLMIRSYIQDGHSIPQPTEIKKYKGAISFGNPGLYKNLLKIDFASLYPNIIRTYEIYDKKKDPKKHFLQIIDFLTVDRLKDKELAQTTGDRYYKDIEQAKKLVINSGYGFLGAKGLNFNYPDGAEQITSIGRDLLKFSIKWATSKDYEEKLEVEETEELE